MGVFSGNFLRSLRTNLRVLTQVVIDLNQVKKVLRGLGVAVPDDDYEPLETLLARCLDQAFQEGWGDLFVARVWAASYRPGPLRDLLRSEPEGLAVRDVAAARMEEVLRSSQSYLDAGQWLLRLAQISHQVCQVEVDGRWISGGFLVGPDLILTGALSVGPLKTETLSQVACRFFDLGAPDYTRTALSRPAANGLLASDESNGFSLLRLVDSPGTRPIGERGPLRGWLPFPAGGDELPTGTSLAAVSSQTEGLRVVFADEVAVELPPDWPKGWVKRQLLLEESTDGSPVFTPEWEAVAINVGPVAAVPLSLVRRRLQELKVWQQVEAEMTESKTGVNPSPRLGQRPVARASPLLAVGLRYFQSAAVLAYFDPAELRPLGGDAPPDDDTLRALLPQCQAEVGKDGQPRWSLNDAARREALASMTRAELGRALESNPRPSDSPLQRALDGCILEKLPPIEAQNDVTELLACARAVGWLQGLPVRQPFALPSKDQLQLRLDWLRLLDTLRQSAGPHFRGRGKELKLLNDYVRAPEGQQERPLVLWGVGGMGKTGLLARFLLDLAEAEPPIPFVLFDFDRPGLSADDLVGLLTEAVRQLCARFAGLLGSYGPYLLEQLAKLQRQRGPQGVALPGDVFEDFGRMLAQAGPLVLVFDTFEELQRRSREQVAALFEFVAALGNHVSRVRPMFGGRAPIEARTFVYRGGLEAENVLLGPLDDQAARESLEALGIERELARKVVQRVGGQPLVLRLAADLIRRAPHERPETWKFEDAHFQADLADAIKQGYLFERIRDHLSEKDEEVARLIHPGLVLRLVTPEVIEKVLAVPCGLAVSEPGRADKLFARLGEETALVSQLSGGVLRFRPELRREMLRLLRRSDDANVRRIHLSAVDYYAGQSDREYRPQDRAEEIYHRLALGQTIEQMDHRWRPDVEDLLADAVDELPPMGAAYLAARYSSGLEAMGGPTLWKEAALADWERRTVIRLHQLLGDQKYQEALGVLAEREDRSADSPLFALHARALGGLGRWREAHEVVERGLTTLLDWGSDRNLLDLWLESIPVEQHLGNLAAAKRSLRKAEQLCARCGTQGDRMNVLRWQMRIEPRRGSDAGAALVEALDKASEVDLHENAAVARELAAYVGKAEPRVAARVLNTAGIGTAPPVEQEPLIRALAGWDRQLSPGTPGGSMVASVAGLTKAVASSHEELWRNWATHITPVTLAMTLARLVGQNPPDEFWAALTQLLLPDHLRLPRSTPPSHAGEGGPAEERWSRGEMYRRLHEAILHAFDQLSLEEVLRFRMDTYLREVAAAPQPFSHVVFQLLAWAESQGRLLELVRALRGERPNDARLVAVADEVERLLLSSASR
jgi:hypothetical protein